MPLGLGHQVIGLMNLMVGQECRHLNIVKCFNLIKLNNFAVSYWRSQGYILFISILFAVALANMSYDYLEWPSMQFDFLQQWNLAREL